MCGKIGPLPFCSGQKTQRTQKTQKTPPKPAQGHVSKKTKTAPKGHVSKKTEATQNSPPPLHGTSNSDFNPHLETYEHNGQQFNIIEIPVDGSCGYYAILAGTHIEYYIKPNGTLKNRNKLRQGAKNLRSFVASNMPHEAVEMLLLQKDSPVLQMKKNRRVVNSM